MRRVVQQVNCAHWRGTHRLEGGFGFCACHRPPRRQALRELGGAVRGRGSAWTAAACRRCGRWAGWNRALHRIVTTGPGCNPAFQGDAISTGGSRGAWSWSCRRAVAGGETVARRGGPSAGAPAAEERSECATVQEWAGPWGGGYELGGSMRVQSSGPASFGLGPWRKLCWVWIPFGATGAGRCCPRAAAPPRGPKTEMLRQGPLDRLTARSVTGLVRVRGCLKTAVAGRKRWMLWKSHGAVWRQRDFPGELGLGGGPLAPWGIGACWGAWGDGT